VDKALIQQAKTFRKRLLWAEFIRSLIRFLTVEIWFYGMVILVHRLTISSVFTLSNYLVPVLLSTLLVALAAWIEAHRHLPSAAKLLIWLDAHSHAGGFLATSLDTSLGSWQPPEPSIPKINHFHDWKTSAIHTLIACLFCIGAAIFPIEHKTQQQFKLDLTEETKQLQEKLDLLKDQSEDITEQHESISNAIEQLDQANDATAPDEVYKLIDSINSRIDYAEQQSLIKIEKQIETRDNLEALLEELLKQDKLDSSPEMQELAKLLDTLVLSDKDLEMLLQDIKGNSQAQKLTKEQIKELIEKLKKQNHQKKTIAAKLKKCECNQENGEGCCESLAVWLENNAPGAAQLQDLLPEGGMQGISRGEQTTAPLTYDNTAKGFENAKHKSIPLSALADQEGSILMGVAKSPPEPQQAQTIQQHTPGNLNPAKAPVKSQGKTIQPRHRKAVDEYFKH